MDVAEKVLVVMTTRYAGGHHYIEMFYNPMRRHGYNNDLSPVEFERRHFMKTGVSRKVGAIQIGPFGVF